MEDFRLKPRKQPRYILDSKVVESSIINEEGKAEEIKGIRVCFGDKIAFYIDYDEKNIKKIEERQEKQADEGILNLPKFKLRKTIAGCMITAGAIVGPAIGTGLATTMSSQVSEESDLTKFAITVGAVTLGSIIPGIYKLIKTNPKVKQLQKLKFRNENKATLDSYTEYENALAGISSEKKEFFNDAKSQGKNPFSIMYVDNYTQDDLERIVENIEREKEFQFVYKKKNTSEN